MNPEKSLRRIIEYAFYCLFIIVPLILTPYNFELFEFNKMLSVYFFTVIIAAAWIARMIIRRQFLFKRTPFDLPLLLFLVSQVISTILSIDPHTSLWGYYSRFHGGLMSTISYLILYYAFVTNMRGKTKKSLAVILTTAAIVSAYAIAQHLGVDAHLWAEQFDVRNRAFSTIGQPNWLAAYLAVLLPLTAWKAAKKPAYYLLFLLLLSALYFTNSRSGFLAGGATMGFYVLFLSIRRFGTKLLFIPLGILLILGFWQRQYLTRFFDQDSIRQEIELENKIHDGGSSSELIRRVVWKGALDIWRHYPIFGSGVETFAYSYYNFRPLEHNLLSEWDFLYNKAHNEFLNFLATSGAFGLISYSLIIIWFALWAKKAPALVAGFLGLSVSNFFGFAVVPVALFFFLWPAFALDSRRSSGEASPPKTKSQKYFFIGNSQTMAIVVVALTAFWLLFRIINWWQADKLFNFGRNYVATNQLEKGYGLLVNAVGRMPNEPLFRNDLAEVAAKLAVVYDQTDKASATPSAQLEKARDQLINQAISQSDRVLSQNKVHLNFYKSRIKVFLLLDTIDSQYVNEALQTTLKAIELSPTDAKLRYNLGLLYQQMGQTGLAEQVLMETVNLKPNYEAARFSLGSLYQQLDQPELAREQYQYIIEFLNPQNDTVKTKLEQL